MMRQCEAGSGGWESRPATPASTSPAPPTPCSPCSPWRCCCISPPAWWRGVWAEGGAGSGTAGSADPGRAGTGGTGCGDPGTDATTSGTASKTHLDMVRHFKILTRKLKSKSIFAVSAPAYRPDEDEDCSEICQLNKLIELGGGRLEQGGSGVKNDPAPPHQQDRRPDSLSTAATAATAAPCTGMCAIMRMRTG